MLPSPCRLRAVSEQAVAVHTMSAAGGIRDEVVFSVS